MLSTVNWTSPGLLPFLSSLFWDEPIVPTNYFHTCYSLLVGFILLGNHHSRARIFKPGYDADALAVSLSIRDVGKTLKKLHKPSKCINERSEQMEGGNLLWGHSDEQSDPDGETAVPGDPHSDPGCHRGDRNDSGDETNALHQRNRSGVHRDEQEVLKGVQGDWRRQSEEKGDLRGDR